MANDYPILTDRDWVRWNTKIEAGPNGCIYWTARKNPRGYGVFRVGGGVYLAHKLALVQIYGQIPEGLQVRHQCPGPHTKLTRSCVNPDHLDTGTAADNGQDQADKGTFKGVLAGMKNGMAKLSDDDVLSIYRRVHDGEDLHLLAEAHGVTSKHIKLIRDGQTRRHLGLPEKVKIPRGPNSKRRGKRSRENQPTPHEITLFKQHCGPRLPNGCVRWNGAIIDGYGQFTWRGEGISAHRFSYLLAHGVLLSGRDIAHECADRSCVSPQHLSQTTRKQNMRNKKTRQRISESNKGNRGNAKLSDEQIRKIKERLRDTSDSAVAIAKDYKVSDVCIANIRKGKTGTHVEVEGFKPQKLGKPPADSALRQKIREMHESGMTQKQIALELGRSQAGVSKILKG